MYNRIRILNPTKGRQSFTYLRSTIHKVGNRSPSDCVGVSRLGICTSWMFRLSRAESP
ncbi:MAG: hypothetical protein LBU34_11750 [Planctomycetaceae bacterium]|nr:hypothetical protein [Planctomycetaceae bacterium]